MKHFALFFAALSAYTVSAAAPGDWGKGTCARLHPNVHKAIEKFCNYGYNPKTPILTGENAAQNGQRYGNAWVHIGHTCWGRHEYVPWDICFKQFYDMCISGNNRGENARNYGGLMDGVGCQKWIINNPA
ncbi:hypothetical protein B0A48_03984 [Cryoendolithus antarcticus]|uniref:Uncharacterized protein n=1 Tax=Cryoendolithus antarcticus TaxID=1507870 RepID=A0A1V8THC8_9PEZI|nr:hypothetical protein B0A48_03984 [Cryoendolithus antarcticus]